MSASITTLVKSFELATQNSIRRGHPPFGEILAQYNRLSSNDQNLVLDTFCRIWSSAVGTDSAAAADQYVQFVSQPAMTREMASKLMRVTRAIAQANARAGNYSGLWAMRDAARHHIDLSDVIDQVSSPAAKFKIA